MSQIPEQDDFLVNFDFDSLELIDPHKNTIVDLTKVKEIEVEVKYLVYGDKGVLCEKINKEVAQYIAEKLIDAKVIEQKTITFRTPLD